MRKLLVVRNDKLGDLILILPALKLIKSSCSNIQIDCLVDKKYSEISSITKYIDNTIYDDANLVEVINNKNYDFSISFYSSFVTAYKLWLSNIPKRYAPATKLAQMFHNKKIKQNRSLSLKSEYEYNNALAKFFLKDNLYKILPADNSYISLNEKSISSKNKILIFIHPFTGGSSKTLSGDDFIQLCFELDRNVNCKFILHCASDDYVKCQKLVEKAKGLDISTIDPTNNLIEMYKNINSCDLFIAGSTGPLHVAASLNKKTVGFYPSKQSSTLVRWDTINDRKNKLTYSDTGNDKNFIKVDLKKIANEISRDLLNQL